MENKTLVTIPKFLSHSLFCLIIELQIFDWESWSSTIKGTEIPSVLLR